MLQPMTLPTLAQLQEGVEIATQIEIKTRQLKEMFAPAVGATMGRSIPGIPTLDEVRGGKRGRGLSAAGRKRISQAMKRRWADRRAQEQPA